MNTWLVIGLGLLLGVGGAVMVSMRQPPAPPDAPVSDATGDTSVDTAVAGPPKPATLPSVALAAGPRHQTGDGLTIIEVKPGSGPAAKAGDSVDVHYIGRLYAGGTQFDSSYDRGQPITFTIGAGNMIKGFDEGVTGLQVGGKRELIIPPDLGYGPAGRNPIPPNATLVFDIELMKISAAPSN